MTGTTIAHFFVHEKLGGSNTGALYRGEDLALGRIVAIKFLREEITRDPERMARFEHEIRILSSLHSPYIASIYGLEESAGVRALVMEFVEGSTLADRTGKGAIPIPEALATATQIANALAYAHERGIIHRDLKPANVKALPDGSVKVLGFGLANAFEGEAAAPEADISETANRVAILARVLLGAPPYMSPEQVRGKPVDHRTDIWSFGCLLYEMLAGKPAFGGETVTDTLAAVTTENPDWNALPHGLSPKVLDFLKNCLRKDPALRLRNIGEFRSAVEEMPATEAAPQPAEPPAVLPAPLPVSSAAPAGLLTWKLIAGFAVLAFVACLGALIMLRPHKTQLAPMVAYIPPSPGTSFRSFGFGAGPVAVSPNGAKLAFTATDQQGVTRIWVRPLADDRATSVPGTENAALPFWSPDGKSLGFVADGALKTVDLVNGGVQILSRASYQSRGAWSQDGIILFEMSRGGPIYRIPEAGGTATFATNLQKDDPGDTQPAFLPDGKHFLYVALAGHVPQRIELGSLDSSDSKVLLENALYPAYAAGYLLFVRGDMVFAQPFDLSTTTLSGAAVPVARASAFSVAGNFVLAYQGGSADARLQWFDRAGNSQALLGDVAQYSAPRISPDGRRALISISGAQPATNDLWAYPAAGGVSTRLTFGPGDKYWCVWSPDSKSIAYAGYSNDQPAIFRQPADGSGAPEVLTILPPGYRTPAAVDWSSDARFLSFDAFNTSTNREESWVLSLAGDHTLVPAAAVSADQFDANFSPDGRWLAYFSYETGRPEVYVVPFPAGGGKYQISHDGGWDPRWSRSNQLFFLTLDDRLTEADITLAPNSLEVSAIRSLFQFSQPLFAGPLFDVTPDGARFLAVTSADSPDSRAITLLLNWPATLKK